jgi:choline-sulfatase
MVLAAGCARQEPLRALRYPNAPVVIISIDTLRADHLPAYGYRGVQTPAIDQFRHDAILFENAYAHVPLTLPSHISMLTGELPPENGVRNNIGYRFDAMRHETIPSLLHKRGYVTGAAVSAYVLRGSTGVRTAFDFYDDAIDIQPGQAQGELQRAGSITAAVAERWIEREGKRPFFFLLHLFEPHSPYTPPEPFRSRFKLPYDGEIATADAVVGDFLDFLKRRNIYDRAIIILMSDHGEGLMEHGEQEHGIFLYREDLHVPLILKLPRSERANQSVRNPAGLIDIFPTIVSLIGSPTAKRGGASLLSIDEQPVRRLYSETLYPRIHLGLAGLRSLIDDRHHFIEAPKPELYDFVHDSAERRNIIALERRVSGAMRQELEKFADNLQPPSRINPEEAKRLAALGYMSATTSAPGPLPDPKDHIEEIAAVQAASKRESRGDLDGAIAAYRAVLGKNPRFTDAWLLLAKALEKRGRYSESIDSYERATQLAPESAAENAVSIAQIFAAQRRYTEALRALDAVATEQAPLAEFVRGDLLARSGRIEEAKAAFLREIKTFPAERQPYASLAVLQWLENDRTAAKQTLEALVRANPRPDSFLFAAKVLGELGDQSAAAQYRQRAGELPALR